MSELTPVDAPEVSLNVEMLTKAIELNLSKNSLEEVAQEVARAGALMPQTLTDDEVDYLLNRKWEREEFKIALMLLSRGERLP